MVKEIQSKGKTYYICEACDMAYKEKEIAQKCEDWCNKTKSCNLEYIKYSVKKCL